MPLKIDNYYDSSSNDQGPPCSPPFKPLKEYVDDKVIHEVSLFIVVIIEASLRKSGHVLIKEKRDELAEKIYLSLTSWGTDSKYFFKYICSEEYISETFLHTVSSLFRRRNAIVSDLSKAIMKILEQLDFPPIKKWIDNEYRQHERYKAYCDDKEMRRLLKERKSDYQSNVSSSPLSDVRLKTNIRPVSDALKRIELIQGVEYTWRKKEFKDMDFSRSPTIGFIAQDLEKLEPSLVFTGDSGFKEIHYGNLVSLLVEAIKEQQLEINDLKINLNLLMESINNYNCSERSIAATLKTEKIETHPSYDY